MNIFNTKKSANFLLVILCLLLSSCAHNLKGYSSSERAAFHQTLDGTVWQRLFAQFKLGDISNARIDRAVQNYLNQPKYLALVQRRAEPYLYFILGEIEKKQLPGEFALLPIVESSFAPTAVSTSAASGLWQFMPRTGRSFALRQNNWYDGRNDVYAATQAASKYLQQLGAQFAGDWLLALAAYNSGQNNIRRVREKYQAQQLPSDYWSMELRQETSNYVPKLLAIAKILSNAGAYGVELLPIADQPYFARVMVDSRIDLNLAAKMSQTPMEEFVILNPAHKRSVTPPTGPHHLLIKTNKVKVFKQHLRNTAKGNRHGWTKHKVSKGENLSAIARYYGSSVVALQQSNYLSDYKIVVGQRLLIPHSSKPRHTYIVQKGDTVWAIARQFATTSQKIANWNNISLSNFLHPGQKLIIKKG